MTRTFVCVESPLLFSNWKAFGKCLQMCATHQHHTRPKQRMLTQARTRGPNK